MGVVCNGAASGCYTVSLLLPPDLNSMGAAASPYVFSESIQIETGISNLQIFYPEESEEDPLNWASPYGSTVLQK